MDLATVIGIVTSITLIGLSLNEPSSYWNLPSVFIVLGGTIGATLTNYPLRVVLSAGAIIKKTLFGAKPAYGAAANQLLEFSFLARREGILSIEANLKQLPDPYLRKGMQLLVDGLEPQTLAAILEAEINNTELRHETGTDLLGSMAAYAPAMGLIGTVIGLVQMLGNLKDPSSIGPAMAVALLTTFYGALLANLLFLPLCGKLKQRSKEEILIMEMQLAGILGIAKGENPRIIKETLDSFQAPQKRTEMTDFYPLRKNSIINTDAAPDSINNPNRKQS
ncbi:MAG: MotA/TolQ/ExbB proton channel family protein [Deltaproteobacteria bacterium]|jgi:chemotaxis protein MotA|nr:MotA/TolQ/ExbB proton channel family protein [Deltaproteobacteria bacterium]